MEEIGFFFPSTEGLENKAGVGEEPTTFFSWKRMTVLEAQHIFYHSGQLRILVGFGIGFGQCLNRKKSCSLAGCLLQVVSANKKCMPVKSDHLVFHPKDQCFLGNHVVNSKRRWVEKRVNMLHKNLDMFQRK